MSLNGLGSLMLREKFDGDYYVFNDKYNRSKFLR